jgi:hypothetical protein
MGHSATIQKPVKVKKTCCKNGPRCKRCPVVLKRLGDAGFADRLGKREYLMDSPVPKAALKRARARKSH